jgi:hypothetical protein
MSGSKKVTLPSFSCIATSNKQVLQRYCLEFMIIEKNIAHDEDKCHLLLGEI